MRKGFEGAAGESHAWHSGRRGDVLSPYVPTASGSCHSAWRGAVVAGMAAQADSDGDARSRRPDVTASPA
jgi:hypothetical protein